MFVNTRREMVVLNENTNRIVPLELICFAYLFEFEYSIVVSLM